MELVDVPEPPQPGPGEVVVGSMAVGICGSDYHFFSGHLTEEAGGGERAFPKIQGHEVAGTISAVGEGCVPSSSRGGPVALHPLSHCGNCYPCRVGRTNACDNFQLIGIHVDGGLQERLVLAGGAGVPDRRGRRRDRRDGRARVDRRARGASRRASRRASAWWCSAPGRSGSRCAWPRASSAPRCWWSTRRRAASSSSRAMGARPLRLERPPPRWWHSRATGPAARARRSPSTPPACPAAVRAMVDMAASAARVVQVGMSGEEVTLRVGSFTEKELDMLGVCCCGGGEFAEAVELVERNSDRSRR